MSGPVIKTPGIVNHQMMHVSDWFPTLVTLAGGSLQGTKLDGYDMWQSIINNKTSPRNVSYCHCHCGTYWFRVSLWRFFSQMPSINDVLMNLLYPSPYRQLTKSALRGNILVYNNFHES